jgi:hypothetical protein
MKKATVSMMMFLTVFLVLALTNTRSVNAQPLPTLTVIDHINVDSVGQIFNVSIELTLATGVNVTNLKGWQIKLGYNTTILDCKGAQLLPGHPFEGLSYQNPPVAIDEAAGYAAFMCMTTTISDYVNVTETKPLCKFTFNSTALGTSYLNFLNVNATGGTYMINNLGIKIPVGVSNGTVDVIPEFPLVSLLAIFLVTTAATLAIKKKKWIN